MASAFDNLEVWRWLLEFSEQVELPSIDVITEGGGPIEEETFDTLLRECGFNVYGIYTDASIDTLVLGREGWDPDGLDALIDNRRGQTLNVYSQEMLLSYLMTAQDPYGSPAILSTFAEGHAGLEYLRGGGFDWPTTMIVPSHHGGSFSLENSPERGVLTVMGYRTGLKGLGPVGRRAVLACTFENELPSVGSKEYMEGWGRPKSSERLLKIANSIASTVRNQKRNSTRDMSAAISEREADLEWLRKTYYAGRFRFPWPSTYIR